MSLPAAEVAADFRDALQDLRMNSRPEISNLTLIAKENTEYAQAISTELEQHIKSVSCRVACSYLLQSKSLSACLMLPRLRHVTNTS
jgi:hypothetical protein